MKAIWLAGLPLLLMSAVPAVAQPVIGAKSGIVNHTEGKVFLADKVLELQPAQFPEVKEGVVMRTEEGRAEVLLTPGVVLRIGETPRSK
jgi:hypothetical protein